MTLSDKQTRELYAKNKSTNKDKRFTDALAEAAVALFATGLLDPSAQEIAEQYFGELPIGGDVHEVVRKKLTKIRNYVEEFYPEYPVILVSEIYYVRYRGRTIATVDEVHRCLPIGNGKTGHGLYVPGGGDDPLFEEWQKLNAAKGAGMVRNTTNRTTNAFSQGRIGAESGGRVLTSVADRLQPDQPEIVVELSSAISRSQEPQLEMGDGQDEETAE